MRYIAILIFCVTLLVSGVPAGGAESQVLRLYEKGNSLVKEGNFKEAVQAYSSALNLLESDEKNAHVVILARARAYHDSGELERAFKDVSTIVRSETVDAETLTSTLHLRARLHLKQGRDRQALSDMTSAIKVSHENQSLRSLSFTQRGIIYLNLNRYENALSDFNKAIELDPDSGYAYAGRGLAYLRLDKIDAARRNAEIALGKHPDDKTKKLAAKITNELSVSSSGPLSLAVPIGDDGHIFVLLKFNKNGPPHRFLLDTGATFSLISRELLNQIQQETEVKSVGKARVKTADGSEHMVTRYKVKNAFLFNLPLGEVEVHVFDKNTGVITNLLGMHSIKNISVSIDAQGKKANITRKQNLD